MSNEDFKTKMENLAALIGYQVEFDKYNHFHFFKAGGFKILTHSRTSDGKYKVSAILPTAHHRYGQTFKEGGFNLQDIANSKLAASIKSRILLGYEDAHAAATAENISYNDRKLQEKQDNKNIVNCCNKYFNFRHDEQSGNFFMLNKQQNFSDFECKKSYSNGYDIKIRALNPELLIKIAALLKENEPAAKAG